MRVLKPIRQPVLSLPRSPARCKLPTGAALQEHHGRRFLAVADEEGYVSVVDTSAALPSDLHLLAEDTVRPRAQWEAHKNAIFDLAWAKARLPLAITAPQNLRFLMKR